MLEALLMMGCPPAHLFLSLNESSPQLCFTYYTREAQRCYVRWTRSHSQEVVLWEANSLCFERLWSFESADAKALRLVSGVENTFCNY